MPVSNFLAHMAAGAHAATMASPSENAFALYRRLTDPLARLVIRIGYKILCIYWRQQKIKKIGVGVLIHHNGQVLTVRHSYRPEYTIPGGGIGKAETPAVAAARELCEELSLQVAPEDLVYVTQMRNTHLMELHLTERPDIQIDNREIIEAVFLSPEEAIRRNPNFRLFLEAQ
jgi:8-oxo-dGTP diphosphatase